MSCMRVQKNKNATWTTRTCSSLLPEPTWVYLSLQHERRVIVGTWNRRGEALKDIQADGERAATEKKKLWIFTIGSEIIRHYGKMWLMWHVESVQGQTEEQVSNSVCNTYSNTAATSDVSLDTFTVSGFWVLPTTIRRGLRNTFCPSLRQKKTS